MNKMLFEKTMLNSDYLRNCSKEEVTILMGTDVAKMIGFEQNNPHHCYDLWNHTIGVIEALRTDAPRLLKIAAFFHDIGKPYVAKEKAGRLVFYGHAMKSSEIAETLLKALHYSKKEIIEICFYIRHHDDFISWVLTDELYDCSNKHLIEINRENILHHICKVSDTEKEGKDIKKWKYLLELCQADVCVQAEEVWQYGKLVETKKHKLERISAIMKNVENIDESFL